MDMIAWLDYSTSFKALMFLSFQRVHKKHKVVALHTFFPFSPTKEPRQPNKFPLTKESITHPTPLQKREKILYHTILALEQCKTKWSAISSSPLHK